MAASGPEADGHLRIDMRPDRVELSLQTRALAAVTDRDTELAHHITGALDRLGLHPAGATAAESPRPVQILEMAIDALDIAAIRPFWKRGAGLRRRAGPERPASMRLHLDRPRRTWMVEPRRRSFPQGGCVTRAVSHGGPAMSSTGC